MPGSRLAQSQPNPPGSSARNPNRSRHNPSAPVLQLAQFFTLRSRTGAVEEVGDSETANQKVLTDDRPPAGIRARSNNFLRRLRTWGVAQCSSSALRWRFAKRATRASSEIATVSRRGGSLDSKVTGSVQGQACLFMQPWASPVVRGCGFTIGVERADTVSGKPLFIPITQLTRED